MKANIPIINNYIFLISIRRRRINKRIFKKTPFDWREAWIQSPSFGKHKIDFKSWSQGERSYFKHRSSNANYALLYKYLCCIFFTQLLISLCDFFRSFINWPATSANFRMRNGDSNFTWNALTCGGITWESGLLLSLEFRCLKMKVNIAFTNLYFTLNSCRF